jgi:hypothetical protein
MVEHHKEMELQDFDLLFSLVYRQVYPLCFLSGVSWVVFTPILTWRARSSRAGTSLLVGGGLGERLGMELLL